MKLKLKLRYFLQLFFLGLILYLAWAHQKYGIEKAAPIDAYCPFGAIEGFFSYVLSGKFLQRLFVSSFILGGIIIGLTLILGRVFCSHICPIGTLSEWIRALGRKLGIKKEVELPENLDKYLRFLKYIVLLIVIIATYYYNDLVFRNYDPFNALSHFGQEWEEKYWGYIILGLIVITALFTKAWWCRYLCPFGALLGIIKKVNIFKITRDEKTCNSCGLCNRVCLAKLPIKESQKVTKADCISCLTCIDKCPKNSLKAKVLQYTLTPRVITVSVLVLFFLPLSIFMVTAIWQTKTATNIIDSSGKIDVTTIKGSNTLANIIEISKVPYEVFARELGLPTSDKVDLKLQLKAIGQKYEIKKSDGSYLETEDFREVIRKFQAGELLESSTKVNIETGGCPFDIQNDRFPGQCGLYADQNANKICDLSE